MTLPTDGIKGSALTHLTSGFNPGADFITVTHAGSTFKAYTLDLVRGVLISPGAIGGTTPAAGGFTTLGATTSVISPKFGSAAAAGLNISPGGNGTTLTFGDPGYGIGTIGSMTFAAGAMAMNISGTSQAIRFTTGSNAMALAGAITPLIFSGANLTGTGSGSVALNRISIASDTSNLTGASDGAGKLLDLQWNVSGAATGGRVGLWAQINASSMSNAIEINPINAIIIANSAMGGSFLQPFATGLTVGASATNVGNTLNEINYCVLASGQVGVKGGLQIAMARGDLYPGVSADAGLFFANSNIDGVSQGMANVIALGNTAQGFPTGPTGSVIGIYLQVADQGFAKRDKFIPPAGFAGIDLQYMNTSIASGYSFRGAGFYVDGTGQVRAGQGLVLGRSGANYTIDTPSTFAVNSVAVNVPGVPVVISSASRGNYYPGDIISGTGSPAGQYRITNCKVVSYAITAGGSGGTNGAQVVTLVGGTGSGASFNVTVTGGVITSVNSIASAGNYTLLPANLNACPVSGASLTGATLSVGIGALTVAILVPDVFDTNITAIDPVGGSGVGLSLTATNQVRNTISVAPLGGQVVVNGTGPHLDVPGPKVAGRFYASPISANAANSALSSANRLFAVPFFVGNRSTALTLSFDIGTGIAGAWNARMGIYADDGTGKPGALVANSDGGIIAVGSGTVTGVQTVTMNGATGVPLLGWYWLAFMADTTGQSLYSISNSGALYTNTLIGHTSASNMFSGNQVTGYFAAQTFGAMPGTFPAPSILIASPNPYIAVGF